VQHVRCTPASFFFVVGIALVVACAEAGGEVKGGELTDAGLAATNPPPFTPPTEMEPAVCRGTGTRWSDLYNDIFGPTGEPGSCSYRSNCHGSPDSAGARSPAGIQCYDMKGCRQSFFDRNLVAQKDSAAPEKSGLLLGLLRHRKADGTVIGFMPQSPAGYLFSDVCVDRIKTWIRDGLKDD
jgi:hypothetical protein